MLTIARSPRQNYLLAALPEADYKRLLSVLEPISLPLGWAPHESSSRQYSIYFPTHGIISLLNVAANGNATEVAMTGNDGLIGIHLLIGGENTRGRAAVRSAGFAYRAQFSELQTEFRRGGPVQDLLLRYTQALMTQIAQNAVCNRHHNIEQRLCRWLLMSLDRSPSPELKITQQTISNMLGVRREGVTEAAKRLQDASLISYARGHITIIDRPKLEARVCECYAVIRRESDRLLPPNKDFARSGRRPTACQTGAPVYDSAPTLAGRHDMISKG